MALKTGERLRLLLLVFVVPRRQSLLRLLTILTFYRQIEASHYKNVPKYDITTFEKYSSTKESRTMLYL